MLKRIKAIICFVLCNAVLFLTCPVTGHAQEYTDSTNAVNDNSEQTEILSSEGIYIPKTKDILLQRGFTRIESLGNGRLDIFGSTTAQMNVDTVKVTVTLQRKVGGIWNNVTSWTASKSNNYIVNKSLTYYTTKGYKYRLLGYHYVKDGSTSRDGKTATGEILLN